MFKKLCIWVVIGLLSWSGGQEVSATQSNSLPNQSVQWNLQEQFKIYKENIELTSTHIVRLQERQDQHIASIETFVYWVLALISALFVLLGIFLALFTYKTNRDYKQASTEFKEASKTLREAKHLQEEARTKALDTFKSIQDLEKATHQSLQQAYEVRQRAQSTIEYELTQGKIKISGLVDEAQKNLNSIVDDVAKKTIAEIDKRNKIDSLFRSFYLNLQDKKSLDRGEDILNQILSLDPNNAQAYYEKSFLYGMGNNPHISSDFKRSLEYINRAIELSNDVRFVRRRSYLYVFLNQPDKALSDIQNVKNQNPKDETTSLEEIEIYILLGKYERASELLSQVLVDSLPLGSKFCYSFLNLILKNLQGSLSEEEITQFQSEFGTNDFSGPLWDLTQLRTQIKSQNSVFTKDQKLRLEKMLDRMKSTFGKILVEF